MLPASNKGPSLNFGFPDVCLTPVGPVIVPIPYPNFGAHAMAAVFCPTVLTAMIPSLNLGSVIAMTTGDEPGVAHWTTKGPGTFDMGNPVVFVDLLPGICLTCQSDGNTGNDQPGMVVAPGAPNVLYTLASTEPFEDLLAGPPLRGAGMLVAEGIGYLGVRVFSWRLAAVMFDEISRLLDRGMRALILDLRGCPGGELSALVDLAGDFVDRGAHLVTMHDAEGDRVTYEAQRDPAYSFPLALLVDGGTASAAELFAASLSANGRALILGAPTHGKRTGQILVRDASGGASLPTAARFSTPGAALDEAGRLLPDVEAPGLTLEEAISRLAARLPI